MHLLTGMNLLVNLKQLIYPRVSWHSANWSIPNGMDKSWLFISSKWIEKGKVTGKNGPSNFKWNVKRIFPSDAGVFYF